MMGTVSALVRAQKDKFPRRIKQGRAKRRKSNDSSDGSTVILEGVDRSTYRPWNGGASPSATTQLRGTSATPSAYASLVQKIESVVYQLKVFLTTHLQGSHILVCICRRPSTSGKTCPQVALLARLHWLAFSSAWRYASLRTRRSLLSRPN